MFHGLVIQATTFLSTHAIKILLAMWKPCWMMILRNIYDILHIYNLYTIPLY